MSKRGTLIFDTMGAEEYRALAINAESQRKLFALSEQTRDLLSAFRKRRE